MCACDSFGLFVVIVLCFETRSLYVTEAYLELIYSQEQPHSQHPPGSALRVLELQASAILPSQGISAWVSLFCLFFSGYQISKPRPLVFQESTGKLKYTSITLGVFKIGEDQYRVLGCSPGNLKISILFRQHMRTAGITGCASIHSLVTCC